MSRSTEKVNIGAQQCSFAQLVGANDKGTPCHVQQLYDDVQVCYGCERYSTVIPDKFAAILEESDRARKLIASFISGAIASTTYRPLSILSYRNNREQHYKYAELVDGDGIDPDAYECIHLEFSGQLQMTVRPPDLDATGEAVPSGVPFVRDLVEALIGPLGDEKILAAEKLLANGWSFVNAVPATHDSYAHVLFWKGYERKYTHPDGTVVTVPKGIRAKIGESIFTRH